MRVIISQRNAEARLTASLRTQSQHNPHLVFAAPSYEDIEAAIAAGPETEVPVTWSTFSRFEELSVRKGAVIVQTKIEFDTVMLTQLTRLKREHEDAYSFEGAIVTIEPERESSLGPTRSYGHDHYRVSMGGRDGSHRYEYLGGGHGTLLQGQPLRLNKD